VKALESTNKSPLFFIKSILAGFPLPTSKSNPVVAIIIPRIFSVFNLSLKKTKPNSAIKIGAMPIIHPVFEAVVYFIPVTWIHKWKTAIKASTKMYEWFFRLILKFLFCTKAIINNKDIASSNLIEIIVSGVSSSSKYFVAINEAPQKRTANSGSQNMYGFVLIYLDFSVFFADE
jgi:hypothetical protein